MHSICTTAAPEDARFSASKGTEEEEDEWNPCNSFYSLKSCIPSRPITDVALTKIRVGGNFYARAGQTPKDVWPSLVGIDFSFWNERRSITAKASSVLRTSWGAIAIAGKLLLLRPSEEEENDSIRTRFSSFSPPWCYGGSLCLISSPFVTRV